MGDPLQQAIEQAAMPYVIPIVSGVLACVVSWLGYRAAVLQAARKAVLGASSDDNAQPEQRAQAAVDALSKSLVGKTVTRARRVELVQSACNELDSRDVVSKELPPRPPRD